MAPHKDEEHKCSETRQTKNRKLYITMLLPMLRKQMVNYKPGMDVILFPMNSNYPIQVAWWLNGSIHHNYISKLYIYP